MRKPGEKGKPGKEKMRKPEEKVKAWKGEDEKAWGKGERMERRKGRGFYRETEDVCYRIKVKI